MVLPRRTVSVWWQNMVDWRSLEIAMWQLYHWDCHAGMFHARSEDLRGYVLDMLMFSLQSPQPSDAREHVLWFAQELREAQLKKKKKKSKTGYKRSLSAISRIWKSQRQKGGPSDGRMWNGRELWCSLCTRESGFREKSSRTKFVKRNKKIAKS